MQVDDLSSVMARRQADHRDRPTQENRAEKPAEPEPRSTQTSAVTGYNAQGLTNLVDPAGFGQKTGQQDQQRHLIDLLA